MCEMDMNIDCTLDRRRARHRGVEGLASLDEDKSDLDPALSFEEVVRLSLRLRMPLERSRVIFRDGFD